MSDHDFEKQVRQKLDDLRITPSATLWENIEQGIRAGRRRKTPVLWLSLLLLAVAAGGYWMYDNGKTSKVSTTENTRAVRSASDKSVLENKVEPPASNELASENIIEPSEINIVTIERKRSASERDKSNNPEVKPGRGDANSVNKVSLVTQKTATAEFKPERSGNKMPMDQYHDNNVVTQTEDISTGIIVSKQMQLQPLKVSTTSGSYEKVPKVVSELPSGEIPGLVTAPAIKLSQEKKWSFGVNGFAGMTTMNDGKFFNLGETQVADLTRNAGSVSTFAPSYSPSTISPGFSYAAGMFVKRRLNQRFSLTSGVSYLHLNTKHNVGKRIFGALAVNVGNSRYQFVNNAFVIPQGEVKSYTNTYHFIEVPLIMNMKLNRSPRYPLYWNAGVAYSRLISSNSLLFDGSSGLYYSNENLLNKSHASLITGFDVALFSNTKTPVSVGPIVRYNVSKLLNENIPENKNFLSLGIDVKLFLR